jgi:hypothetical protein
MVRSDCPRLVGDNPLLGGRRPARYCASNARSAADTLGRSPRCLLPHFAQAVRSKVRREETTVAGARRMGREGEPRSNAAFARLPRLHNPRLVDGGEDNCFSSSGFYNAWLREPGPGLPSESHAHCVLHRPDCLGKTHCYEAFCKTSQQMLRTKTSKSCLTTTTSQRRG